MNTSLLSRLTSLALAACVTTSVLLGIDSLARRDAPHAATMASQPMPPAGV